MHKSCPASIKAAGADDGLLDGQFRALVSVFGNKDSYGDVIRKGAFAETLSEWKSSGDPIPVYWSHRMDDPDMNIGWVVDAKETDAGLEVLAQLDPEGAKAQQVYRLLKGRRVSQFSFAYDVLDGGAVEQDGESYYELRKLKLYEVGPTPIGANQETDLLAVKAAAERARSSLIAVKDSDVVRETLDRLAELSDHLKSVLAVTDDDEAKHKAEASETGPAKDEEPPGAKSEEPSRATPVETLATSLQLMEMEAL